jgi:hypothetical protein
MISSRRRDSRVLAIPNVYKYPSPQCLTLLSFFLPLLCCSLWVRPPGAGFYHPLRATSDGRAPRLLQIFQVSCTFGSVLVSRGVASSRRFSSLRSNGCCKIGSCEVPRCLTLPRVRVGFTRIHQSFLNMPISQPRCEI